jgi:hypothetical protein
MISLFNILCLTARFHVISYEICCVRCFQINVEYKDITIVCRRVLIILLAKEWDGLTTGYQSSQTFHISIYFIDMLQAKTL